MALIVHQVAVGGFDKNFSYIIADDITRQALVVDPNGDFLKVSMLIATYKYKTVGILLTHTHFDHIDMLTVAVAEYHTPIYVHEKGILEIAKYEDVRVITDGAELALGASTIHIIYTPGHTDDSICFYIDEVNAEDNVPKVITGDTLFIGGCGRTNELRIKDLYESLAELGALPDKTVIFPGHDYGETPTSTIGYEKKHNKYYLVENFTTFQKIRLG